MRKPEEREKRVVDKRVQSISQMAEKKYYDQKRKLDLHTEEEAKKAERDRVLIPHQIQQIKEQQTLQRFNEYEEAHQPAVPTFAYR